MQADNSVGPVPAKGTAPAPANDGTGSLWKKWSAGAGTLRTALAGAIPRLPPQKWTLMDVLRKDAHAHPNTGEVNSPETSAYEQQVNRYLKVSAASLGLVSAGYVLAPGLVLVGVGGLVYCTIPIWQQAYSAIRQRKVKLAILNAVAVPAIILTGYFWTAGLGYTLYFIGEKLLLRTKDSSLKHLTNILGEQPQSVCVLVDGVERTIPFEELQKGDVVVVYAGQMIPIDGIILDGVGAIDQRMLTGEAQPSEKGQGDQVFASTLLIEGRIGIEVQRTGEETVAAQIGDILLKTVDYKAGVELKGEVIADKMTLPTLAMGALALPFGGATASLAVLNAGVGETIKLVAPVSILNFLQLGMQAGILIKDGRALELLVDVDTVVFDKTGTLTLEQPNVAAIHVCAGSGMTQDDLLRLAGAAEFRQTHPIARAILDAAATRNLLLPEIQESLYDLGYGLTVRIDGQEVLVGSRRFMDMSAIEVPASIDQTQLKCNKQGDSLVYVAASGQLAGAIELHATIRPEAQFVVSQLQQRGMDIYIISGDHEQPTQRLARQLGIEHYFAETLPENKASLIEQLQAEGRSVCFVGDGINDSIALKKANVSISLQGASTVAVDTAAIIMLDGNLDSLVPLFEMAQKLEENMKVNLITSIVPGVMVIVGAFAWNFGIFNAVLFYNLGLFAGLANAMRPILNQRKPAMLLPELSTSADKTRVETTPLPAAVRGSQNLAGDSSIRSRAAEAEDRSAA